MNASIESRVLRRLLRGDPTAVRRFWSRVGRHGAPLVERLPGDSKDRLVTFLWRSRRDCDVSVLSALADFSRDRGRLNRLPGTDIWHRSFHVRSDVRVIYYLTDALPPTGSPSIAKWMKYYHTRKKDPLNPQEFLFPADPEDPKDRDHVGSVLNVSSHPLPSNTTSTSFVESDRVEVHRLRSRLLRNERRVWLYRPAAPASDGRDPPNLLLVFDGFSYLTLVPTPTILDRLQARGRIGTTYAVLIDSLSMADRSRELSCNESFVRFLDEELVPWVERQFGMSFDTTRTALVGSSLGGLASAYGALRRPRKFGNVLSQSGAFAWAPEDEEPSRLIRDYVLSPQASTRFYLEAGILETATQGLTRKIPSILDSNRHFRDVLRAKGYPVVYREFAGGHDYLWWRSTLGPALVDLLGSRASGTRLADAQRQ